MDQLESQNLPEFITIKNNDGSETVHYRAFHAGVPNEYKNYAERELGETPEKVSRGIKYLTRFLEDKGVSKTDPKYLMVVLRNCKHDLKKSRVKLEKFLRAKKLIAERVAQLDFNRVDQILRATAFTVLPYRDKHGRLILVTRPVLVMHEEDINDGFVCYMAMLLYTLEFPMTSLFGIAYIGESKTPSITLLYQILKGYKSWLMTLFDLPLGLRKIDVTNESVVIRWFLNFARPVTPTKIFNRISMHGVNLETLKETFHPDLLPAEFDGNMGPISSDHYREKLMDFMRKLREEQLVNLC